MARRIRVAGPPALRWASVSGSIHQAFYALTPDKILDAVEVGGRRATGYALSHSSYENRVYEVALEDDSRLVAKFYRVVCP